MHTPRQQHSSWLTSRVALGSPSGHTLLRGKPTASSVSHQAARFHPNIIPHRPPELNNYKASSVKTLSLLAVLHQQPRRPPRRRPPQPAVHSTTLKSTLVQVVSPLSTHQSINFWDDQGRADQGPDTAATWPAPTVRNRQGRSLNTSTRTRGPTRHLLAKALQQHLPTGQRFKLRLSLTASPAFLSNIWQAAGTLLSNIVLRLGHCCWNWSNRRLKSNCCKTRGRHCFTFVHSASANVRSQTEASLLTSSVSARISARG